MKIKPDFYLVSTEYIPHIGPLECYIEEDKLRIGNIGYLKVTLIPGLYGEKEEISNIILGPRYLGDTLINSPIWPVHVNVFLSNSNNFGDNDIISLRDLKIIAWAEIYKARSDALEALK